MLTVLFLVALTFIVSASTSTTPSDDTPAAVNRTLQASHMLCSPDTLHVTSLMNVTLRYLDAPRPVVSFYHTADKAEEAYLNLTASISAAASSGVVGIHFADLTVASSSVSYSLRFRAASVASTQVLFNHKCQCYVLLAFFCTLQPQVSVPRLANFLLRSFQLGFSTESI